MISEKFISSIKSNQKRQYQIAAEAGINPFTLSQIVCGIVTVKPGDRRVLEVARVLGLKPDECFEE